MEGAQADLDDARKPSDLDLPEYRSIQQETAPWP